MENFDCRHLYRVLNRITDYNNSFIFFVKMKWFTVRSCHTSEKKKKKCLTKFFIHIDRPIGRVSREEKKMLFYTVDTWPSTSD